MVLLYSICVIWWLWWVRLSIYPVFDLSIHDLIKPWNFICVATVSSGIC